MIRKEITLFLQNAPGALGRMAGLLEDQNINIEAISIQDASSYVSALYNARGKSLKRIASTQSYDSMKKDSADFAMVRMLVDQTATAADLLAQNDYFFEITRVIAVELDNQPGKMGQIAAKLGEQGINIDYVYSSAVRPGEACLFVCCPDDIEKAVGVFA